MDAHDSDVCANAANRAVEAVRLLSGLESGKAPDSGVVVRCRRSCASGLANGSVA